MEIVVARPIEVYLSKGVKSSIYVNSWVCVTMESSVSDWCPAQASRTVAGVCYVIWTVRCLYGCCCEELNARKLSSDLNLVNVNGKECNLSWLLLAHDTALVVHSEERLRQLVEEFWEDVLRGN